MARRGLIATALALGAATVAAWSVAVAEPAPAPHTTYEIVGQMSPKALYLLRCSGCHRADGAGAAEAGVPPFPGSIGALAADDEGRTYIMHVPGVRGAGLSDAQTAAVMNYILDVWAKDRAAAAGPFTAEEVARRRAVEVRDVVAFRRAMVKRLAKSGVTLGEYPWP